MSRIPHIFDETAELQTVVVGIADSPGATPSITDCYDPKSKEHVRAGTYPLKGDLIRQVDLFAETVDKRGIEVLRPDNIDDLNQIFARDVAFAIGDKLHVANMIADRKQEAEGMKSIFDSVHDGHLLRMPEGCRAEGGDVMPWHDHILVGYSESEDFEKYRTSRTNRAGLDYLTTSHPELNVRGFELNKSDEVAADNALHLDCCFQPIGLDMGIIYRGGFKNSSDVEFLFSLFGKDKLIEIDRMEMYHMNSNVFSISPETVVSNSTFTRVNETLRARGLEVIEVPYDEVSKMEGLFRCSTMPLIRK